jgi:putative transposase
LASGRRLKSLTIADDFTHECVDIVVDHGISGAYVVRVLDQIARFRGYPRAVRALKASPSGDQRVSPLR